MTEGRSKSDPLSETCKTHLVDVFVSRVYGRSRDIQNRYTIKGLAVEEDSLTLYSRVCKQFYVKNEETLRNEFIIGTPDIIADDKIIDIKSSWDIFTFFRTKQDKLNKMYYWQLQGYMALTGKQSAELAYCLVNTPDVQINDQKRRLMWSMGLIDANEAFDEACAEIEKLSLYDDIPLSTRCNRITIQRNDEDIERLYQRVRDCREWMNTNLFEVVPERTDIENQ